MAFNQTASVALPNFRLVGHEMYNHGYFGGLWRRGPVPYTYGEWPLVADSYSPFYAVPQTKYGVCDCAGGAVIHNNCNFQQGRFKPQCLANSNCRCINETGTDYGCFNRQGSHCY